MMSKKAWIIGLGLVVALGGTSAVVAAEAASPYIGKEKAKQIALKEAPGIVTDIDFERERGVVYYEVEIDRKDSYREVDVYVDAVTGKILKVKDDDDAPKFPAATNGNAANNGTGANNGAAAAPTNNNAASGNAATSAPAAPGNSASTGGGSSAASGNSASTGSGSSAASGNTTSNGNGTPAAATSGGNTANGNASAPAAGKGTTSGNGSAGVKGSTVSATSKEITKEQAVKLAQQAVSGEFVRVKSDWDDGVKEFEVKLRTASGYVEIEISAATGKVLDIDYDDFDDDDDYDDDFDDDDDDDDYDRD